MSCVKNTIHFQNFLDFLGPVGKYPPSNASDPSSIPGPGRFHMLLGIWDPVPQLLSHSPRATVREAIPVTSLCICRHSPHSPQWGEACTQQQRHRAAIHKQTLQTFSLICSLSFSWIILELFCHVQKYPIESVNLKERKREKNQPASSLYYILQSKRISPFFSSRIPPTTPLH